MREIFAALKALCVPASLRLCVESLAFTNRQQPTANSLLSAPYAQQQQQITSRLC
jgi:hypothetical protein